MLALYVPKLNPLVDEALTPIIDEELNEIAVLEGGQYVALSVDDYYIKEKATGLDELWFTLPITDPAYTAIQELSNIVDERGQRFLVRKIDAGKTDAKIVCELDMDEWKASMGTYSNNSQTVVQTIRGISPWPNVVDYSGITIRRTISGFMTPYDALMSCIDTYGVYFRFNNKTKTVYIYTQAPAAASGVFATRQLNMTEINYKGTAKHEDFATRLYAIGKDGMTFASINDGKAYVDNFSYSERVVCALWEDDRYTDKESLLADAKRKLKAMAVPERAYECEVVDLKAVDPEKYNFLDFSLFTTATLIDDIRGTSIDYQVVERWNYPNYPENNKVIFSDVPVTVSNQVTQIKNAIDNPNSTFRQGQQSLINSATNWLTSSNGYAVAVQNADGSWKELLFMDTNDTETARNVLRINENGIGFSTSGINGPYANAWTIDGNLIADFITSGTMAADRIRGGELMLGGFANEDGVLIITDADGNVIGRWDTSGITATSGNIGGWAVNSGGLSCTATDIEGNVYRVSLNVLSAAYGTVLEVTKNGQPMFSLSSPYGTDASGISATSIQAQELYSYRYKTSDSNGNYQGVSTSFSTPSGMFITVKNGLIVSAT